MSDRDAVAATIRDYIEGWYRGEAEMMDRSLHDGLAKRMLAEDSTSALHEVSKESMVEHTASGGGDNPAAEFEIEVYAISDDIATGSVLSPDYLDYVQLARTDKGWKIVNILYHRRH